MSSQHSEQLIDREAERAELAGFLDGVTSGPAALLLEGDPGTGKTTLWREGLHLADSRGCRLLSSRPAEAEASLSFSVLGDLLREVMAEELGDLPSPQRRALEVALLLAETEGAAPNALAVSLGVRGVLRVLARERPLVIAIDDLQWMDAPSARALDFALRRLEREPVGLMASALRAQAPSLRLDEVVPEGRLRRVKLGPLDAGDMSRLLRSRLALRHPEHVLTRLHGASGGNPLYAMEIGRALERTGTEPEPGAPLPVPDSLTGVLRERLRALNPATRDALMVVSMLAEPDAVAVERAIGSDPGRSALSEAEEAGLLELEEGRMRLAHPLIGTVLYADTDLQHRRTLHRRLAEATEDEEERARHLALAVSGPDQEVAEALEKAARIARGRGAPGAAADLLEQSAGATPADRVEERQRRAIVAAECHLDAGNAARSRSLLEQVLDSVDPGPVRALALQRLGWVRYHEDSWSVAARLFGEALEHVGDDPSLAVALSLDRSMASLFAGDLSGAEQHARRALEGAREAGDPALLGEAMAMVGSVDFLMGQGVPEDVMEQAMGMESWERSRPTPVHPSVAFGLLLKWSDDLSRARSRLQDAYTRAKEEGHERSLPFLLFHLSELECWAGDIELAGRYAEEGCAVATQTGQEASLSFALYARALVDAYRGNVDAARDSAEQGLSLAERSGAAPARVLLASVLGFIELSLGDYSAAHRYLGPLAEAAAEAGVREPGVLRYIGDAIEDLIGLGDLDHARVLLDPLEERAQALRRLWALGVAARCRGLLSSAIGDQEGATQELERALSHHERLGQPFELGRTLLTLGMVQRRALQRRAARKSLEEALEIFHRLGASLWIDRVRAELARIGGRAPSSVELTPTEEQVARLVAEGRTNREVAEAMFLTVRTVEWNVSRIYRKLGVRSRTELSRWVQDRDRPDSSSS